MSDDNLNDIWAHLEGGEVLGDVNRGVLRDKDRPFGVCWACAKLAREAMTHESPGTAKCCIGCDAYEGKERP